MPPSDFPSLVVGLLGFAICLPYASAIDVPFSDSRIVIDGLLDDSSWESAAKFDFSGGGDNGEVTARMTWDDTNAYFGFESSDSNLWVDSNSVTQDDSFEFYLDLYADGGALSQPDDVRFGIDIAGNTLPRNLRTGLPNWKPQGVVSQSTLRGSVNDNTDTDQGYVIEMQIPWTELITPYDGRKLGLMLANNDDDNGGGREGWSGLPGISPTTPSQFLEIALTGGPETPVPMYSNPQLSIKNYNLGDPAVVFHEGRYFLVESPYEQHPNYFPHNKVVMYSSDDLVSWDYEGVVFEPTGTWNQGRVFAPDITIIDGEFFISYSSNAIVAPPDVYDHHIGIARAASITGPYTETTADPLIDVGQTTIDPHIMNFNGESYIYWSQFRADRGISVARLNDDFTDISEERRILVQGPDEFLVEAAWTYQRDGLIYLFYSANAVDTEEYRVGYATATSPMGPFTKRGDILVQNSGVTAPGHNSVVDSPDGTETFIVYHNWVDPNWKEGDPFRREIAIDRLFFREDGTIFAFGPTLDQHPLPSGAKGSFGVHPIQNPGFESADRSGWEVSSSGDSTDHIAVSEYATPYRAQEGQFHLEIAGDSSSPQDALITQTLTGLESGATYRFTAWARTANRRLVMGATPLGGVEVSQDVDHPVFQRAEIDFTVEPGFNEATLWFESATGLSDSWVWIDAIEVFKIAGADLLAADFDEDGDVDRDDLLKWRIDFGQNSGSDADGDGDSDGADFLIWQREIANFQSLKGAPIPEPSTWALIVLIVPQACLWRV